MTSEIVDLLPGEIVLDTEWNSRKEYVARVESEGPHQNLSAEQLETSIAEHGVLQPPRVRRIADGRYTAVFGFRRIIAAKKVAPDQRIPCSLQPSTGDAEADDLKARVVNLCENLHREALQPWETAEALYQIKITHRASTMVEIAAMTGLSKRYVANLVRLRMKAHPTVWRQFQRWGVSLRIPYGEVLRIAALAPEDQVEAWNCAIEARRLRGSGKRGAQKRPGPSRLQKYLTDADEHLKKRPYEFRRGAKFALRVALGKAKWS